VVRLYVMWEEVAVAILVVFLECVRKIAKNSYTRVYPKVSGLSR